MFIPSEDAKEIYFNHLKEMLSVLKKFDVAHAKIDGMEIAFAPKPLVLQQNTLNLDEPVLTDEEKLELAKKQEESDLFYSAR